MSDLKKTIDRSGAFSRNVVGKQANKTLQERYYGAAGDIPIEGLPKRIGTPREKIYSNQNAYIVLGGDRPGSRLSGYAGKGATQSAAIDLVVGLGGPTPESDKHVDPNIQTDAARIYISQKTDIDQNFNLCQGSVGSPKSRSAIALKADGVRIVGREGIKLITNTEDANSRGGKIRSTAGIDIIAGNRIDGSHSLQPMVKGDNLIECLADLADQIEDLANIVHDSLTDQMKYNQAIMTHVHVSPFYGIMTSPSQTVMPEGGEAMMNHLEGGVIPGFQNSLNLGVTWRRKYLQADGGTAYICSRFNKVN